jgi:hypothetical protein
MKVAQYILLTSLLFSCISNNDLYLFGRYSHKGGHWIELATDSTFEYKFTQDLIQLRSSGTWENGKGFIILTSYKQPQWIETPSNKKNIPQDSFIVEIRDENYFPVPYCAVGVKKDGKLLAEETDLEGRTYFSNIEYDSIFIVGFNYHKIKYAINSKYNYYLFELQEEDPNYVYFTNEKWRIITDGIKSNNRNRYKKIKSSH